MKKRLMTAALAATLAMTTAMSALAAGWQQDAGGWWYGTNADNTTYYTNGWQWIDGNGDGIAESYYFDANGYMLANTTTPDDYTVDGTGAWVENGVVQTQTVGGQAATGGYDLSFRVTDYTDGGRYVLRDKPTFNTPASPVEIKSKVENYTVMYDMPSEVIDRNVLVMFNPDGYGKDERGRWITYKGYNAVDYLNKYKDKGLAPGTNFGRVEAANWSVIGTYEGAEGYIQGFNNGQWLVDTQKASSEYGSTNIRYRYSNGLYAANGFHSLAPNGDDNEKSSRTSGFCFDEEGYLLANVRYPSYNRLKGAGWWVCINNLGVQADFGGAYIYPEKA